MISFSAPFRKERGPRRGVNERGGKGEGIDIGEGRDMRKRIRKNP